MSSSTLAGSIDGQPPSGSNAITNMKDLQSSLRHYYDLLDAGVRPDTAGFGDINEGYFAPPEHQEYKQLGPNHGEHNVPIPLTHIISESVSEDDDDDLTPLEYARFHGLSRDYLADNSALIHIQALQTRLPDDIGDDSLPQFDFGVEPRLDERLSLSKDAARLLQSVAHEDTQDTIDNLVLPMLSSSDVKRAKVELPLLRTDHETDCKKFAQWNGFEIKLEDVRFPLEVVDDEKNEGIKFPSAYWKLGDGIMEELKKEKLAVSRDTLVFLKEALTNIRTKEDDEEMWQTELKYKRNTALEPVTPPLFPMYLPPQPYEPSPSSPAFQLDILSDPPSLIKQDLEAIEKVIFEQDIPTPLRKAASNKAPPGVNDSSSQTYSGDAASSPETRSGDATIKLSDLYSPLASMDGESPPTVQTERYKREDLKVEGPLTPSKPTMTAPKSVRFSDFIEDMVIDPPTPVETPAVETFFQDAFGEAAGKVKQRLEQESLIDADTTARVEVRIMETVVTKPLWQKCQDCTSPEELLAMQMKAMRSISDLKPKRWAGVNYPNMQDKIRFDPFPRDLGKLAIEETFEGADATWKAYTDASSDEDIINSSHFTWKPEGLRILNADEDDDDDIEPGKFTKDFPRDMSFLVKKRKLELDQHTATTEREIQKHSNAVEIEMEGVEQPTRKNSSKPNDFVTAAQKMQLDKTHEPSLLLGGDFSAENMLGNFMELRGVKKPKLMDISCFTTKANKDQPSVPRNPTPTTPIGTVFSKSGPELGLTQRNQGRKSPYQPNERPRREELGLSGQNINIQQQQPLIRKSPIAEQSLPAPEIAARSTGVQSIIVSSTLFKQRALIKHLEALLPNLTLVERDFSAHNTPSWMPGSVTRSPITSPLDSEADLIVSASTGVILTTLQMIKQKPLPGSKTKPALRVRLEKVGLRYEKLIVLITEGRHDETTNGLDEHDCFGLSEFTGFAQGLVATTSVHFVGGGEQTLAKWLASVLVQNRVENTELLADETHWELFLRRAGLNSFAVHDIVSKLKAPDGVDATSPSKAGHYGLTAFVEMGRQERIKRFAGVCGRGVLERVSAVMDTRWV